MSDSFEPENYFNNIYPYFPIDCDKFVDKYFPPDKKSIFNEDNMNYNKYKNSKDYKNFKNLNDEIKNGKYVFKRLSELTNPKLTKNYKNITPYMKQGQVGDCLLIAFLNALQRLHKDKYLKLFGNCMPDQGYYEFYFYDENNQEFRKVFVDDYILVDSRDNYPKFSKISDIRYGVFQLIEKAFAKIKGDYFTLTMEGGSINYIKYLTGIDQILINRKLDLNLSDSQQIQDLKSFIINNLSNHNIIIFGSNENELFNLDISGSHAYELLFLYKRNNADIILIKNPHLYIYDSIENMSFSSDNWQIKENNKTLKKHGLLEIDYDKLLKSLFTLIICPFTQIPNEYFNNYPQQQNLDEVKFSFKNRKNYLDYLGIDRNSQIEFMNKYSNMEEGLQSFFEYCIENGTDEIKFEEFLLKSFFQSNEVDQYIKKAFSYVSGQIFGV